MDQKSADRCFVVMRIGKEGSDDHSHFRALYDEFIKPMVAECGYTVVRADDFEKGGAITSDIIRELASSDLVIADLTDLNPNVFYELGVRHSLVGRGTIMIVDDARTSSIPFDIGAYRVLKYTTDMKGLGKLREGLRRFILGFRDGDNDDRDNPVHDILPQLPASALLASEESSDAEYRSEIRNLQKKIRSYEERFGLIDTLDPEESTPLAVVHRHLDQARDGTLTVSLLEEAQAAGQERDVERFLRVVARIMESSRVVSSRDIAGIISISTLLGLDEVNSALWAFARSLHPADEQILNGQLAFMAHSADPKDREQARQEILRTLRLDQDSSEVALDGDLELPLVAMMLDAYQTDGLHQQALQITTKLLHAYPDRSIVLRNHGRALAHVGRLEEGFAYYKKAVSVPDVDDGSAVWYGNALHNERRFVDAAEAYAFGCRLDPDGATPFSHLADDISRSLVERDGGAIAGRRVLPEEVGQDHVLRSVSAALSCSDLDNNDLSRVRDVLRRIGLGDHAVQEHHALTILERAELAREVYQHLQSDVTRAEAAEGA